MKTYKLAIVGATGVVGRTALKEIINIILYILIKAEVLKNEKL